MARLDRDIAGRFLLNFVLLFGVLYLFAATIDVILNLDEFTRLAEREVGEEGSWVRSMAVTIMYAADYNLPQVFQFYAWLYGIVAVGAAAFTLAQMSRYRELVAIVASGMSLRRVAAPFLAVGVLLGGLQVLNQELVLPKVASLLLRKHGHADQESVDAYPIRFTSDAAGTLIQAASFDPSSKRLTRPSFIERDAQGRTTRRWWGNAATWDPQEGGWHLEQGQVVGIRPDGRGSSRAEAADLVPSDLSPVRLTMRRYEQMTGLLSLGQISEMLAWPDSKEASALRRSATTRFSIVVLNLLVLAVGLPFFLDRLPGDLFPRAVRCTVVVLPLYFTAAGLMLIPIPTIGPLVGGILPVLLVLPIALARLGGLRT